MHLAREGRQVIAANRMGDLLQAIDRLEPKNAALYYNTARPFARLAGRNQSYAPHYSLTFILFIFFNVTNRILSVLHQSLTLADRARNLQPTNSDYVTEYANIQDMLGTSYISRSTSSG